MAKTMLYNGVELPDIESVWTGEVKEAHPRAMLVSIPEENAYSLLVASTALVVVTINSVDYYRLTNLSTAIQYTLLTADYEIPEDPRQGQWVETARETGSYDFGPISEVPLLWNNFKIARYPTGTTYAEASPAPVDPNAPTFTPADFLRWFSLGQAVRRGIRARGQATMYSYNGVVLPNIESVWTGDVKETRPYVAIAQYLNSGDYVLYMVDVKHTYDPNNNYVWRHTNNPFPRYLYNKDTNKWEFYKMHETGGESADSLADTTYYWANHDIVNEEDGSVWMAKTDPVPIYK